MKKASKQQKLKSFNSIGFDQWKNTIEDIVKDAQLVNGAVRKVLRIEDTEAIPPKFQTKEGFDEMLLMQLDGVRSPEMAAKMLNIDNYTDVIVAMVNVPWDDLNDKQTAFTKEAEDRVKETYTQYYDAKTSKELDAFEKVIKGLNDLPRWLSNPTNFPYNQYEGGYLVNHKNIGIQYDINKREQNRKRR